jgi:membrane-bound metal-dependent hydrolase YbcI (DUF457 family)
MLLKRMIKATAKFVGGVLATDTPEVLLTTAAVLVIALLLYRHRFLAVGLLPAAVLAGLTFAVFRARRASPGPTAASHGATQPEAAEETAPAAGERL